MHIPLASRRQRSPHSEPHAAKDAATCVQLSLATASALGRTFMSMPDPFVQDDIPSRRWN